MNQINFSQNEGTGAIVDPSALDPNFLLKKIDPKVKYKKEVAESIAQVNNQIQETIQSIPEMSIVEKLQEHILKTKEKELQGLYDQLHSLQEAQKLANKPTIN